jgi:hypothetical protein
LNDSISQRKRQLSEFSEAEKKAISFQEILDKEEGDDPLVSLTVYMIISVNVDGKSIAVG